MYICVCLYDIYDRYVCEYVYDIYVYMCVYVCLYTGSLLRMGWGMFMDSKPPSICVF